MVSLTLMCRPTDLHFMRKYESFYHIPTFQFSNSSSAFSNPTSFTKLLNQGLMSSSVPSFTFPTSLYNFLVRLGSSLLLYDFQLPR
mmetsp:Transcript_15645/g.35223  ORF Transcript_15645/g.35223 Transcript_15645/m.35223 type:complete len:86 (+) Transcript_15645:96-353(+)